MNIHDFNVNKPIKQSVDTTMSQQPIVIGEQNKIDQIPEKKDIHMSDRGSGVSETEESKLKETLSNLVGTSGGTAIVETLKGCSYLSLLGTKIGAGFGTIKDKLRLAEINKRYSKSINTLRENTQKNKEDIKKSYKTLIKKTDDEVMKVSLRQDLQTTLNNINTKLEEKIRVLEEQRNEEIKVAKSITSDKAERQKPSELICDNFANLCINVVRSSHIESDMKKLKGLFEKRKDEINKKYDTEIKTTEKDFKNLEKKVLKSSKLEDLDLEVTKHLSKALYSELAEPGLWGPKKGKITAEFGQKSQRAIKELNQERHEVLKELSENYEHEMTELEGDYKGSRDLIK